MPPSPTTLATLAEVPTFVACEGCDISLCENARQCYDFGGHPFQPRRPREVEPEEDEDDGDT
jgi:hypothetical protein